MASILLSTSPRNNHAATETLQHGIRYAIALPPCFPVALRPSNQVAWLLRCMQPGRMAATHLVVRYSLLVRYSLIVWYITLGTRQRIAASLLHGYRVTGLQ